MKACLLQYPLSEPRLRPFEDAALFPLLLLLLAIFLFPIAVYCSVLGMMNRRPNPLVVSGAWDFVGVLLATSGFLLFVGPALLSGAFRQSMRDLPFYGDADGLAGTLAGIWAAWWGLWIIYYLLVVGGAAFLVWTRSTTTVVYNIDAAVFDDRLTRAAHRLGLAVERRGNRLYLVKIGAGAIPHGDPDDTLDSSKLASMSAAVAEALVIDLEPFPLLSNISLHWQSASASDRADLERELRNELAVAPAADGAAGGWLLGIGAMLFIIVMVMTGVFILLVMMLLRR